MDHGKIRGIGTLHDLQLIVVPSSEAESAVDRPRTSIESTLDSFWLPALPINFTATLALPWR